MARFFLTSYTVRLRRKNSREYLHLDNFANNHDFLATLTTYLRERQANRSINGETQKLLGVLNYQQQGRTISGRFESGEYGYEAELYDVQADAMAYQRTMYDAEVIPFYFRAQFPNQQDEGVLVLQRRGQLGVKLALMQDFSNYFGNLYPNLMLEINPLVPQQLIDQLMGNGELTKVRFVRFDIPNDITDAYEGGGHVEQLGHAELVILARRNRRIPLLDRVRDVLARRRQVNEMVEIQDFDYDTVKVEIQLGSSKRTVDLSDVMNLRSNYDVTDDLEIGADGHPLFDSIDGVARELLEELMQGIGAGENNAG